MPSLNTRRHQARQLGCPFQDCLWGGSFESLRSCAKGYDERPSVEASKREEEIQILHELVKTKIEKSNASYQENKHKKRLVFQPRDLVWIHLRKEYFPSKLKNNLMSKADAPFEVLEKVNDNTYKVNLPGDYGVSATFNVADLSPFLEDDHLSNLSANSPQQGEDDGGPSMESPLDLQNSQGNINSSYKAKGLAHDLLSQVSAQLDFDPAHKSDFMHLTS